MKASVAVHLNLNLLLLGLLLCTPCCVHACPAAIGLYARRQLPLLRNAGLRATATHLYLALPNAWQRAKEHDKKLVQFY